MYLYEAERLRQPRSPFLLLSLIADEFSDSDSFFENEIESERERFGAYPVTALLSI